MAAAEHAAFRPHRKHHRVACHRTGGGAHCRDPVPDDIQPLDRRAEAELDAELVRGPGRQRFGELARIAGLVDGRIDAAGDPVLDAGQARLDLRQPGAPDDLDSSLETASGDYIAHLAGLVLQSPGAQGEKQHGKKSDTRIADIRKQIARSYRSPDLKPGAIGERLGISARSIQHVLSQHGSTFSEELMAMRLEAAFGMLRSGVTDAVADIAFKCGFSDLSTFHRAFRARYGKTPNAARVTK